MKFISTAALVGVAAASDATKTVVTTECAALNVKAFTDAKCATAAKEKADLKKATDYGTHWKAAEKCQPPEATSQTPYAMEPVSPLPFTPTISARLPRRE